MSKLICKFFKHSFIPHNEAALLRALAFDRNAKFCDRCGFNTVVHLFQRLVDDIYDPEFANDEKATEMWHKISNGIKEL
jgi:hypothetical protein